MKEIGIDELKEIQLDMLTDIDSFCRKNKINYTLAYGTLIGAIRHKGYIPWDDDIDIAMPRPSYDKFLKTFNGNYDYLHVFAPELDNNFYAPYANVCNTKTVLCEVGNSHRNVVMGIKIDIFPIDGTSESVKGYRRDYKKMKWIKQLMFAKRYENKFKNFSTILWALLSAPFKYSYLQEKGISILSKYDFCKSSYVQQMAYPIYTSERLKRELFENYIEVEFENRKFRAIDDYDVYLTSLYGNYMQLPPKEKQIPHHGFSAYWKD